MAAAGGRLRMVATLHSNYRYPFQPEVNQRKIAEIQQALGEAPKMLLGCDFHLSYENIKHLLDGGKSCYTINRTKYLSVELDEHLIPQQLDPAVVSL